MSEELKSRTKEFVLRVVRLAEALPGAGVGEAVRRQLLRAGTSVGANYRSACRAKSRKDFIAKLAIVVEECDETLYWMELLVETNLVPAERLADLMTEANELLSIMVTANRTARL